MTTQTEPSATPGPRPPWFVGRPGTVLLYRVNRRPMPQPTLGAPDVPPPLMDHLEQVLLFGLEVLIGKGRQRKEWILGNRYILPDLSGLTGQVGWQMVGEQQRSRYLTEKREWSDEFEATPLSAHAPFAFDSRTRILGVLKHHSFGEKAVAEAFENLLRKGENLLVSPSIEWSVEPILDERDFLRWLQTVSSVTILNLVAKLPNPDGLEQFGSVWAQMEQRRARLLQTRVVAANEEDGLENVLEDQRVREHLAMGGQGFGDVKAEGPSRENGSKRVFNLNEKVARRVIDEAEVGTTWQEATTAVLTTTRNSADVLRPVDIQPEIADFNIGQLYPRRPAASTDDEQMNETQGDTASS
jgi:hypothetical protein